MFAEKIHDMSVVNLDVFKTYNGFHRRTHYENYKYNKFWEGRLALKELKCWAKENGFNQITIMQSKKIQL